jgi:hypothetical protein
VRQLGIHNGKLARAQLAAHTRFRMHFTPVHCSWMNQVRATPNFRRLCSRRERILRLFEQLSLVARRDRSNARRGGVFRQRSRTPSERSLAASSSASPAWL